MTGPNDHPNMSTSPTMSTQNATPAPQWAVEAAKEITGFISPKWDPFYIAAKQKRIETDAAIIARHAPNWIAPKAEDHPIGFPVHPFTPQPTAPTAQPEQPAATGTPDDEEEAAYQQWYREALAVNMLCEVEAWSAGVAFARRKLAASRPTAAMVEACAAELVALNYHVEALKKGGTYDKELQSHRAILAKHFNPEKKP